MKDKRARSNKEVLYRYSLFKGLMDNIPDVIYFKDREGKFIMVNKAHAKGLGLAPEDIEGKTDFDIFPRKRAMAMAADDAYVMKTGRSIVDKIERHTRGDRVDNFVSTTKIPRYDAKGRIAGIIGITRDITRRVQIEKSEEEKKNMQKKIEALETVNRMKSEFVSVVSHELRTPLAIIKEAVSIIYGGIAGPLNEAQKGLLAKAAGNAERLNRIIGELLDISRIERGAVRIHFSLTDMNALIKESADYFRKLAKEKNITLRYSMPRGQVNIFVDQVRINQVISNLITNAVKFTEEGGRIRVAVNILKDKVRVGVTDTGTGIPKKDIQRIFGKFIQVSKKEESGRKGVGLGLAISKELVKRHGGEIWAESTPGVGSRFYFTLPRFYTSCVLKGETRKTINSLIGKKKSVYMINLYIVNIDRIKALLNTSQSVLFRGIRDVIESVLGSGDVFGGGHGGEYGIILSDTTENGALKFCRRLRNNLISYFGRKGIKDVFINLSILSQRGEYRHPTTVNVLANLHAKKMFLGAETRRFRRVRYDMDVDAGISRPDGGMAHARTIDISAGGLCMRTGIPFETDAPIELSLNLPGRKRPILANGRAAWMSKEEVPGKKDRYSYKIGVEFSGIRPNDKKALLRFITRLSAAEAAL